MTGWQRGRLVWINATLVLTLAGSLWGKKTSLPVRLSPQTLSQPLDFRGWKPTEQSLTPREQELLLPDALLLRRYHAPQTGDLPGAFVDFAVIAGHRKQTVHTPAFCMAGGGWETLSTEPCTLNAGGQQIEATRMVMARGGQELVATFFFTDGDRHTRSLAAFQARQLQTRLRGQSPVGALVRVVVPVQTTREAACDLTDTFAQAVIPVALNRLHPLPR